MCEKLGAVKRSPESQRPSQTILKCVSWKLEGTCVLRVLIYWASNIWMGWYKKFKLMNLSVVSNNWPNVQLSVAVVYHLNCCGPTFSHAPDSGFQHEAACWKAITANQPRSCAAATFLPAATKLLWDLTSWLSYCYTPVGNVTEPSLVHLQLPVVSRSSSSRFHGSSSPRLQSSTNARQIHGSSPPRSPSFPRTSPQLPALRSLRRIYTPASSLWFQVSLPRSSGTLDRAPSVSSIVPVNN